MKYKEYADTKKEQAKLKKELCFSEERLIYWENNSKQEFAREGMIRFHKSQIIKLKEEIIKNDKKLNYILSELKKQLLE